MVTSRDVAATAGVSQATVSRVISGSSQVSENTRVRVLDAMHRTGYEPNHAARVLRTQRSGAVGMVVADILNPFYPELIAAAAHTLERRGRRMILWESDSGGDESAAAAIGQGQIDGAIFTSATPALTACVAAGRPTVLVNRTVADLRCDQVGSNNYSMSRHIAKYFAAAGHAKVGLLTANGISSTADLRATGFRDGVTNSGMKMSKRFIRDATFSHAGGYLALLSVMSSSDRPTAIFCVNDLSAMGALDAARSLHLRVPEDLWLTGYDNINMASWEAFDLSTAKQPIEAMVELAVDLLLRRIDQPDRTVHHYQFRASLEIRGSTAQVPFAVFADAEANDSSIISTNDALTDPHFPIDGVHVRII